MTQGEWHIGPNDEWRCNERYCDTLHLGQIVILHPKAGPHHRVSSSCKTGGHRLHLHLHWLHLYLLLDQLHGLLDQLLYQMHGLLDHLHGLLDHLHGLLDHLHGLLDHLLYLQDD